jgi:putative colanic acid biosynthesis acetyltransferase WcaF
LLRLFGAKIGRGCRIAPSCFVWAPWNLIMEDFVALAQGVDCYSVDKIILGSYSTVSQRAFICTASHDVSYLSRPLIHSPIIVGEHAWICAESFVAPGVEVGHGAIVGARSVVTKNVSAWTIVAGNPARYIRVREIVEINN